VARRAAVRICNRQGEHHGNGLDAGIPEAQEGLGVVYLMTGRKQEGMDLLSAAVASGSLKAAEILKSLDQSTEAAT
jgi:hypothetical protein